MASSVSAPQESDVQLRASTEQQKGLSLGICFETLLETMDGILRDAINRITDKQALDPTIEELAQSLDEFHLRLRLWSNDILDKETDDSASISDVLDIVEEGGELVATDLRSTFSKMRMALEDLQPEATHLRHTESSIAEQAGFRPALRRLGKAIDELDYQKSAVLDMVAHILRHEIQQAQRPDPEDSGPLVLTFDGGGVRSLSTLLILQDLMDQIRMQMKAHSISQDPSSIRPHHIFDYIFGSSSGGLIAIMLGRLKMSESECLENFEKYCSEIFRHPRVLYKLFPFLVGTKYSEKSLLRATRLVVGAFDPSPQGKKWKRDIFACPGDRCKTGVLAVRADFGEESTYLFRSYDVARSRDSLRDYMRLNPEQINDCQIWQVARATSAAPLYFPSVKIDGSSFVDGGLRTNNPTQTALTEVSCASRTPSEVISRTCLVSIGAGARPPVPRSPSRLVDIMRFAVRSLRETESTHKDVMRLTEATGLKYYRLGVPILDLELDEWRVRKRRRGQKLPTADFIRQETTKYLNDPEVGENLRQCAETLVLAWQSRKRKRVAENLSRPKWGTDSRVRKDTSQSSFLGEESSFPDTGENAVDAWLDRVDHGNWRARVSDLPRDPDKRITVAVLDTGIDMSRSFISENKGRIQCFPDEDTCVDDYGHGTSVTALLLRVAPHIQVNIAKVTDRAEGPAPSVERVVEALHHFINEVHVDFITISFGWSAFDSNLAPILLAIKKARDRGIIIFAATTSYGISSRIGWPASLGSSHSVIPVYSCDCSGRPSAFNPKASDSGICSLGEGFNTSKLLRSKFSDKEYASARATGTAFSASIVTGLAAIVYDFLKNHTSGKAIRVRYIQAELLAAIKMGPGMEMVLGETCTLPSSNKMKLMQYVTPWFFFEDEDDQAILYDIQRALRRSGLL